MTAQELKDSRRKWLDEHLPYKLTLYSDFNYKALNNVMYIKRAGRGDNDKYANCIIMADTETSKKYVPEVLPDYDYDDIKSDLKCHTFKYDKKYNEVASYREFQKVGIKMSKNGKSRIDVYYEDLKNRYPYIFKYESFSELDALYYIYEYISHKPEIPSTIVENHVVAWTISLRAFDRNIVTLYGHRPSEMITTINNIKESITCDKLIIYFHNYSYDYVFLRLFMFDKWGYPIKQLNTNSHYPIYQEYENGIIIRDSLILAQRALEKWASDLDVEHKKAVGKWDYEKIRNQSDEFTADELEYIENDTLAGVECLQKTMDTLNKRIYAMPYTATGIPREEVKKRGLENRAHDAFMRQLPTYEQQMMLEAVYHGGYTHAYRNYVGFTIDWDIVQAQDFASSYPFCMLACKFPKEKFWKARNKKPQDIIECMDEYAYMFKFIALNIRLKNNKIHMPALQFSKCVRSVNPILDNGRILCAGYIEIYLTEMDLAVIMEQYDYDSAYCVEVQCAAKGYLPRWFTDYAYECFEAKTMLKGGDPVLYSIAKAKLNSLYGMCVQKPIREDIVEDYKTGEYDTVIENPEELYQKFTEKHTNVLPYQIGVWVTAHAFYNLFQLGKCCDDWIYSDTDSCYGIGWHEDKLQAYNQKCIDMLADNNYGPVAHNNRLYYLGIAESDGDKDKYTEFRVMGAKRYCGRCVADGELHITVAGVPKKKGALCLNNNINRFKKGLIFDGVTTGKKTHTYFFLPDAKIYIDKNGNETGDSVDLSPCDYELDMIERLDWEKLFIKEVPLPGYFEEDLT